MERDQTAAMASARDMWRHEALDFTPWLLNNGRQLADALSIDLELHSVEHPVGPFSVDLIGRDTTNDCVLIVENQLEPSDHSHLGQLLTYAAGTAAETVVWVATHFRNEHGRALDWLNRSSVEGIRFYGVEVHVAHEGESLLPALRMVVGPSQRFTPNLASKSSRLADDATATMRVEFFNDLLERLRLEPRQWRLAARGRTSAGSPIVRPIRAGQIWCTFLASQGRVRVDLYLDDPDGLADRRIFDQLYAHCGEIEAAAGQPLVWERDVTQGRGCRIAAITDGTVGDPDRREENIAWCARQVVALADAALRWTE